MCRKEGSKEARRQRFKGAWEDSKLSHKWPTTEFDEAPAAKALVLVPLNAAVEVEDPDPVGAATHKDYL
jgi:hypothetical protein